MSLLVFDIIFLSVLAMGDPVMTAVKLGAGVVALCWSSALLVLLFYWTFSGESNRILT
jgi:hypothetical protein